MRIAACLIAVAALNAQGAAVVTTVDQAGDVGLYTSMQLDGAAPVISYYDFERGALKLARCIADCRGAAPRWSFSVVDAGAGADVGLYTSLQINAGRPVIAYFDFTRRALKLATCVSRCDSDPQWILSVVDNSSADTGRFPTLRIVDGKPMIAYRDKANRRLKLATCVADCEAAAPTWIVTTVDGDGEPGRFEQMAMYGGKPIIAYLELFSGTVRVATCLDACASAAPTWSIRTVDSINAPDIEMQFGLQVDAGKVWVSYYVARGGPNDGTLRVAACASACDSPGATWSVQNVDSAGNAGRYSAMQVKDGKPIVVYDGTFYTLTDSATVGRYAQAIHDFRVAACISDCTSAEADWVVGTIEGVGNRFPGWYPSAQVDGSDLVASFYEGQTGDLRFARMPLASVSAPSNHTGLWWNATESGWGVNFSHQGAIVFATLFTYDASGAPMWLVMSEGARTPDGSFTGPLYRTTGPAFDARPFAPITAANLTRVGDMTVRFAGDAAELIYSVNGRVIDEPLRKQVFGAAAAECHPASGDRGSLANHQDLWWNPSEAGWGLNVTQQGGIVFATLFTYARDGRGLWLVLPAGARQADGSYLGDLYRTTGPSFDTVPFKPIGPANLAKVGTMRLAFATGTTGTLTYSMDGTEVVKAIERQVFASPPAACAG